MGSCELRPAGPALYANHRLMAAGVNGPLYGRAYRNGAFTGMRAYMNTSICTHAPSESLTGSLFALGVPNLR